MKARDFIELEMVPLIMDETQRFETISDSLSAVRDTGEFICCVDIIVSRISADRLLQEIGSLVSFICKELKMQVDRVQTGLSLTSKKHGDIDNSHQNKFIIHFKPI